jgi:hypothetical protein
MIQKHLKTAFTLVLMTGLLGLSACGKPATAPTEGLPTTDKSTTSTEPLTLTADFPADGSSGNLIAKGGIPPYKYTVDSGSGSVDSNGYYKGICNEKATVSVTDSTGAKASINAPTGCYPKGPGATLSLTADSTAIGFGATAQLKANNGVLPLTFYKQSGLGSFNSSTALYTAPNSATTAKFAVKDGAGTWAYLTITVSETSSSAMKVTYNPNPIYIGNTVTLNVSGGTAPYTYTLVSGSGELVDNIYSAPLVAETASVKVEDSDGKNSVLVSLPILSSPEEAGPTAVHNGTTYNFMLNGGGNLLVSTSDGRYGNYGGTFNQGPFAVLFRNTILVIGKATNNTVVGYWMNQGGGFQWFNGSITKITSVTVSDGAVYVKAIGTNSSIKWVLKITSTKAGTWTQEFPI